MRSRARQATVRSARLSARAILSSSASMAGLEMPAMLREPGVVAACEE